MKIKKIRSRSPTDCLLQTCCHKFLSSFFLRGLTRQSAAPLNMHLYTVLTESCEDITGKTSNKSRTINKSINKVRKIQQELQDSYHTYDRDVFASLMLHNQCQKSITRYGWQIHFSQYQIEIPRSSLEYFPCLQAIRNSSHCSKQIKKVIFKFSKHKNQFQVLMSFQITRFKQEEKVDNRKIFMTDQHQKSLHHVYGLRLY